MILTITQIYAGMPVSVVMPTVLQLGLTMTPVFSVAGRRGDVTLTHADIEDWTSATALTPAALNAVVGLLPTTEPASPNIVWLNGNIICVS